MVPLDHVVYIEYGEEVVNAGADSERIDRNAQFYIAGPGSSGRVQVINFWPSQGDTLRLHSMTPDEFIAHVKAAASGAPAPGTAVVIGTGSGAKVMRVDDLESGETLTFDLDSIRYGLTFKAVAQTDGAASRAVLTVRNSLTLALVIGSKTVQPGESVVFYESDFKKDQAVTTMAASEGSEG